MGLSSTLIYTSELILRFTIHGWEGGANLLDQSQSEVKQNQNNPR